MKHEPYFAIKGYQIIKQVSDDDISTRLGITTRTLWNKINGRSDFTASEAKILSEMLGVSQASLFLTKNVS